LDHAILQYKMNWRLYSERGKLDVLVRVINGAVMRWALGHLHLFEVGREQIKTEEAYLFMKFECTRENKIEDHIPQHQHPLCSGSGDDRRSIY
jgi:hypothetical protein